MRRSRLVASFFRGLVVLALLILLPFGWAAQATQDKIPVENVKPSHLRWSRTCTREADVGGKQICFTAQIARAVAGELTAMAVLVERKGESRKTLRVVLPLGMQIARGTRILVDAEKPMQSPYLFCVRDGCVSDYDATPELIELLAKGNSLVVQATNQNGAPLSMPLPLADLQPALAGRAAEWRSLDDQQRKILVALFRLKNERGFAVSKPDLHYPTPWTKFCLTGKEAGARPVCFTGKDGRQASGLPVVAAVVIEPEGDQKKLLRLTLPLGMNIATGIHIIVDGAHPLERSFLSCLKIGCMSDYELTPELLANLRSGHSMAVQATMYTGRAVELTLPLRDFGQAYDGAPVDATLFAAQQKKLQQANGGQGKRR